MAKSVYNRVHQHPLASHRLLATHLDKLKLGLLLGETGPELLLRLLLPQHETEVLARERLLDLLDFDLGEEVERKLVRLGLDLGRGSGGRGRSRVSTEGNGGGRDGEGVRGVELGNVDSQEDDILLSFGCAAGRS